MKYFLVSCNRQLKPYPVCEFIYAEAAGSYTYVYLTGNRRLKHCKRLGLFISQFNEEDFFRIHHGYFIHAEQMATHDRITFKTVTMLPKTTLPIAKRRVPAFRRFYKQYRSRKNAR